MPNFISEDQIEKAAVELLTQTFGYRTLNCYTPDFENLNDNSKRSSKNEVAFIDILKVAAVKLNPQIPEPVIDQAIENLTARRSAMTPILANKEVYGLIRNGVPVQFENAQGKSEKGTVKVIDFENSENNDFCAVTQLWVKGDRYPRRPDILIYINGLPLVFIELKNSNVKLKNAYDDNLCNYKHDIPLLFNYNAFCVLSNGLESRVGSISAGYEHFFRTVRMPLRNSVELICARWQCRKRSMKTATATALMIRSSHSTGPPWDNITGNVGMALFIGTRTEGSKCKVQSAAARARGFALLPARARRILPAWNNQTSFARSSRCRKR